MEEESRKSFAQITLYNQLIKEMDDLYRVWNEEAEEVTVFAVNRNLEEDLPLTMDLRSFEGYELIGKTELVSDDLQTVNSAAGEKVHPRQADDAKAEGGQLETVLRKASWNVIRLGRK